MKKILLLTFVSILFSSCDMTKDLDLEEVNTSQYLGEWYFSVKSADLTTNLKALDAVKLSTYNTAADISNEIWIDIPKGDFKIKFKANFSGDISSFSSSVSESVTYSSMIVEPDKPTALGLITNQKQSFLKGEILGGKIIKNGTTSKTGIKTDAIELKIKFYRNSFTFTSIADGASFKWSKTSETEINEEFVIIGHRYTGFPEDKY